MNIHKTRSQLRLDRLINAGRPLNEEEQRELYRALHADYMRKWRASRAAAVQGAFSRYLKSEQRKEEGRLLDRVLEESGW